uniref:Putative secreted protein n=1 Tax=Anopheles triannulatus TaxID=58253 RepID=A0A2M4B2C5_9DIPT
MLLPYFASCVCMLRVSRSYAFFFKLCSLVPIACSVDHPLGIGLVVFNNARTGCLFFFLCCCKNDVHSRDLRLGTNRTKHTEPYTLIEEREKEDRALVSMTHLDSNCTTYDYTTYT